MGEAKSCGLVSSGQEIGLGQPLRGPLRIRRFAMERLLTIQEAAEKLGVRPNTLYLWVSQKRIPHRKIGRLVRFRECDLEQFVEQKRQPALGEKNGNI